MMPGVDYRVKLGVRGLAVTVTRLGVDGIIQGNNRFVTKQAKSTRKAGILLNPAISKID